MLLLLLLCVKKKKSVKAPVLIFIRKLVSVRL